MSKLENIGELTVVVFILAATGLVAWLVSWPLFNWLVGMTRNDEGEAHGLVVMFMLMIAAIPAQVTYFGMGRWLKKLKGDSDDD